MIHRIYSSLPSFKNLEFHSGLNVLIAQKEANATDKQTRNRAGKTSLIETIHFLTGSKTDKDSLFRIPALIDYTFGLEMDLKDKRVVVERSGKEPAKIRFDKTKLSNTEWSSLLGEMLFALQEKDSPTFRSLYSYFVRRQNSNAFTEPQKQATMQQTGDYQVALLYLLGFDWRIAQSWQAVRNREKTLAELKKAASAGALGAIIGKASELRTQLTIAEAELQKVNENLQSFHVLPQYAELELEADQITRKINEFANENIIDLGMIKDLEIALNSEAPPPLQNLERIFAEAGIALPGLALKRYDDVRSFHESVVRNRRDYLQGERQAAQARIDARNREKQECEARHSQIMNLLKSHGALEQFSLLQAEVTRKQADTEALRQRYMAAEQLEGTKNELEIERNQLNLRLRQDFSEQNGRMKDAILAFEETSKKLYESAGSMTIADSSNGPIFEFPMQGSRSKGIRNMQIFCFDMMLMRLCAKRNMGPGFLVHDSHLFDGVDGRQLISALKVGAETAKELGFQYIVTLNEDDAFKETTPGFDLNDYLLPVKLTDAREDGGLFGMRF